MIALDATVHESSSLRQRVFETLEHGRRRDRISRLVDVLLVLLIVANVCAVVLQTVPEIDARYGWQLQLFDRLCVLIFAIEYAARIWVAPEHLLLRQWTEAGARLRFVKTPLMLIDALALLPFLLEVLFANHPVVRLTRLVRFLKLARYSPALTTIGTVIAAERRALFACVVIIGGVLLTAAAVMLAVEGHVQPDRLGDMPKAMWWAASMLAKIGGGELSPVTPLGRIIAAATVMLGIFCFALPVAILGRGFYAEIRRRDFLVTFAMVARVPLFSYLDAAAIAELVDNLNARTVSAGTTIVRRGERGTAMYLIASGQVEVVTGKDPIRLQEGDFFGEMSLLANEPRTATVQALRTTDLLVLEADDFHRLIVRSPELKAQIEQAAATRRV